jgi:hypothetical protein
MDFGGRFGTFGRFRINNNYCRMTTHEYQALIKTLTMKERFELNQKIRDEKRASKKQN